MPRLYSGGPRKGPKATVRVKRAGSSLLKRLLKLGLIVLVGWLIAAFGIPWVQQTRSTARFAEANYTAKSFIREQPLVHQRLGDLDEAGIYVDARDDGSSVTLIHRLVGSVARGDCRTQLIPADKGWQVARLEVRQDGADDWELVFELE